MQSHSTIIASTTDCVKSYRSGVIPEHWPSREPRLSRAVRRHSGTLAQASVLAPRLPPRSQRGDRLREP
jgi:hypothetical protein